MALSALPKLCYEITTVIIKVLLISYDIRQGNSKKFAVHTVV